MDNLLALPLAKFLDLRESTNAPFLLEMDYSPNLSNHLNVYHASAIFCFAEISSGAYLVKNFPAQRHTTIPVVRRAQIKYSNIPKSSTLFSKATLSKTTKADILSALEHSGRSSFEIQMDIVDISNKLVFRGSFEWFVKMQATTLKNS